MGMKHAFVATRGSAFPRFPGTGGPVPPNQLAVRVRGALSLGRQQVRATLHCSKQHDLPMTQRRRLEPISSGSNRERARR